MEHFDTLRATYVALAMNILNWTIATSGKFYGANCKSALTRNWRGQEQMGSNTDVLMASVYQLVTEPRVLVSENRINYA